MASLTQNLTRKAGPLPVWAWALAILAVGYVLYRRSSASSASTAANADTSTADTSTTPPTDTTTGGNPGPDVTSPTSTTDTGSLNDTVLSQLGGFQGSLDALTAAVLSSSAFPPGSGDGGSGSTVPNGVPTTGPAVAQQHSQPSKQVDARPKRKQAKPQRRPPRRPVPSRPAPQLISEHGRGVR